MGEKHLKYILNYNLNKIFKFCNLQNSEKMQCNKIYNNNI